MEYSLEVLSEKAEHCIQYLNHLHCDLLCAMFVICNYVMYKSAVINNMKVINKASLRDMGLDTLIYDWRNSYAHLDLNKLSLYTHRIVDALPDDIEYTESMLSYIEKFKETYSTK